MWPCCCSGSPNVAHIVDVHYRGWVVRCAPNRVAGGWCAVAELRRIGRERDEIAAVVPSTAVFSEAGAAWHDGLEVAKRWIDVRLEQSA